MGSEDERIIVYSKTQPNITDKQKALWDYQRAFCNVYVSERGCGGSDSKRHAKNALS